MSRIVDAHIPAKREIALSEIRKERAIGHWKRANDLERHWRKEGVI